MQGKLIMIALMCCFLAAAVNANNKGCQVCKCPRILDYVCGRDGQWYENECELECAGVKWNFDHCCGQRPGLLFGEQPADEPVGPQKCKTIKPVDENLCPCPYIMDPVCARNGQWYNNNCLMECDGQREADEEGCCTEPKPGNQLLF